MILSDFDYPLPKELIAQEPLKDRDASRLLVVDRHESPLQDRHFSNLVDLIPAGDVLVLNDTKVFQARLMGKKKLTGGKVDILLLEPFVGAIHELPLHVLTAMSYELKWTAQNY
jgi:S-adenosylmethionine:tRNA ribosyltransferase-isomerase